GDLRTPVLGFWGTDDRFNPVGGALKFLSGGRSPRLALCRAGAQPAPGNCGRCQGGEPSHRHQVEEAL
ncbi:hypothetical protein ACWD6U_40210, partial [Streptomyces sp. NPDC005149]